MKISEIITDKYKLRIPPTVYYDLLADVVEAEEEQEPRWISVEEDTPPIGTICLWCNKQGSVFTSEITYRSEYFSYVGKHGYFSNGLENHGDIVAWMPLPKPYKAESEKTETWNGIHAQITAPKGTFERIFNNADDDTDI